MPHCLWGWGVGSATSSVSRQAAGQADRAGDADLQDSKAAPASVLPGPSRGRACAVRHWAKRYPLWAQRRENVCQSSHHVRRPSVQAGTPLLASEKKSSVTHARFTAFKDGEIFQKFSPSFSLRCLAQSGRGASPGNTPVPRGPGGCCPGSRWRPPGGTGTTGIVARAPDSGIVAPPGVALSSRPSPKLFPPPGTLFLAPGSFQLMPPGSAYSLLPEASLNPPGLAGVPCGPGSPLPLPVTALITPSLSLSLPPGHTP